MKNNLIYFDNAATGYPKPSCVLRDAIKAFSSYGGNPGRSGHRLSVDASRAIYACRETVCELLNFNAPERVIFTPNATYAINIAIKGLAKKDSHIIISNFEHNSVIRPVYSLCNNSDMRIGFSTFDASSEDITEVVSNFKKALRPNTKLAVVTAVSNVCGKIMPIYEISEICKLRKITLIIDASQALGEIDVDMERLPGCVLCSAGHKGLYGPTGTGFAVFSDGCDPLCIIEGGNGLLSKEATMGEVLPEKLEAGTLNTFGICGLNAGIKFIKNMGISGIHEKSTEIINYISRELIVMGAKLYGNYSYKTPILLFNVEGKDCTEVSSYLDENGICTRGGFHCAPTAHKAIGTGQSGGVRISLGYANTKIEADRFLFTINNYIKNLQF